MDFLMTFEDGSTGYLAHHGVKGMKWGVRNEETKARRAGAKEHAKRLNDIDTQLRSNTVYRENTRRARDIHTVKAMKNELKGNMTKAEKYRELAAINNKKIRSITKQQKSLGEELVKEITSAEKQGYSWKVKKTEFNETPYQKTAKEMDRKYGKSRAFDMRQVNASSGNRFKVKDSAGMSDKRKARWNNKHNINSYRPQNVYYTTY